MLSEVSGLVLVASGPPTQLHLPPKMKVQQLVAYDSEESIRWTIDNVLANPANLTSFYIGIIICTSLGGDLPPWSVWS
jgi:hypothetical protein